MKRALPDKEKVRAALLASLRESLAAMARSAKDTAEGATHAENRSEGDKDMRATEESYVARGKAMRTEELADELGRAEATHWRAFGVDDAIGPGALVRVLIETGSSAEVLRVFLVATHGGGRTITVDGVEITVVTPKAPVGQVLVGKRVGDALELAIKSAMREWVIDAIA